MNINDFLAAYDRQTTEDQARQALDQLQRAQTLATLHGIDAASQPSLEAQLRDALPPSAEALRMTHFVPHGQTAPLPARFNQANPHTQFAQMPGGSPEHPLTPGDWKSDLYGSVLPQFQDDALTGLTYLLPLGSRNLATLLLGGSMSSDAEAPQPKGYASGGSIGGALRQLLQHAMPQATEHYIPTMAEAAPSTALSVVKPVGGQWLSGSVDDALRLLMKNKPSTVPVDVDELAQRLGVPLDDLAKTYRANPSGYHNAVQKTWEASNPQAAALNSWISGPLRKYILNRMASPNDEIRQLADQGITHTNLGDYEGTTLGARKARAEATALSNPAEQLGQTDLSKQWEDVTDGLMRSLSAAKATDPASFNSPKIMEQNPWLKNVPPMTPIYTLKSGASSDLGFGHIVDVLNSQLQEGSLRPEQLNKVSVADAVRRAHEFNAAQAAKMAQAQQAAMEGMPIHKDYGNGMKWVELKLPEKGSVTDPDLIRYANEGEIGSPEEAQLEEWLQDEGDAMGHCVGGYCPDVVSGQSRIFSLRDENGQPHVTVETAPDTSLTQDWFWNQDPETQAQINASNPQGLVELHNAVAQHPSFIAETKNAPLTRIVQIKGKQNAAPVAKYLPYVQDFVKSQPWSEVDDAQNAGLRKFTNVFNSNELHQLMNQGALLPTHGYLTGDEIQNLHNMIYPEGSRLTYDPMGNIIGTPNPGD